MEHTVRFATPEDVRAISEVHAASREAAFAGRLPRALIHVYSPEQRLERWTAWFADPVGVTLVVDDGRGVAGFCTLRPTHDRDLDPTVDMEMPTLYVRPDRWREGVGSARRRRHQARRRPRGRTAPARRYRIAMAPQGG